MASTDVAIQTFDEETLRGIDSLDAAMQLVRETYGEIINAADVIGSGFTVLDDKNKLVGRPMLMLQWVNHKGDFGDFVSAIIVTKDGRFILNDGSTGIAQQLVNYQNRTGRNGGLFVTEGLRRSDYTFTDNNGQEKPATTYYLAV